MSEETTKKEGRAMWKSWRELVSYPSHVPERTAELLDTLNSVVPVRNNHFKDRFVALGNFLSDGRTLGLLTTAEHDRSRQDIGPHM